MSDEASFSLNSEVNTHNVVKYAARGNGHLDDNYVEHSQGTTKYVRQGIVSGPFFIKGGMNTREYIRIIRYN